MSQPLVLDASGTGHPLVIGEVALGHDGSLGMAHAFIDAVASAGAGAVKFQTHWAPVESTREEPWRVPFSLQDDCRYDYWRRTSFTEMQWHGLKRHADERGLFFLSSAFSADAVDLLRRVGVSAWKVASGTLDDPTLVARICVDGLPVIVSTGMSPMDEIDGIVTDLRAHGAPFALLQCTSEYPCPAERVGLNLVTELRERYGCPTGLSDHSGTIFPSLAAATLGAAVLEVHVTFSREMFGPDVPASLTTTELRTLVEGIRFIQRMRASPVDKNAMAARLASTRAIFGKSIVLGSPLPQGTVIERHHLAFKKAGRGMPPSRLSDVVGRRLRRTLDADHRLADDDLEHA
jgi:N,N'-diacetyllegionaminate synthase